MNSKGLAITDGDKEAFLKVLLNIWKQNKTLRLGQLLMNATHRPGAHCKGHLFEASDLAMLKDLLTMEKK